MLKTRILSLKQKVTDFSSLVEGMIDRSISGLIEKNERMLVGIIETDEPRANSFEVEIDELITETIAQFSPKAKELRSVLMMLKMNNDLERIGDLAVNISESSLYLIDKPLVKPLIDIPRMSQFAVKMLKNAIDSFINEDPALARTVCEMDNEVDNLRDQVLRELVTFMVGDASTIERSIHLIRISRNLERTADLSTNICEDVIFMVDGRTIKHHMDEEE